AHPRPPAGRRAARGDPADHPTGPAGGRGARVPDRDEGAADHHPAGTNRVRHAGGADLECDERGILRPGRRSGAAHDARRRAIARLRAARRADAVTTAVAPRATMEAMPQPPELPRGIALRTLSLTKRFGS